MEKRVPVTTYVGADRTVIGEAIIHEDGTCTMTLTSDALTALRVTDRDGDFSMNWFQNWTEEEKAEFARRAAEENFGGYPVLMKELPNERYLPKNKIYDPKERLNLGFNPSFAIQDELLQPVQPKLEDVLKAEMYEVHVEETENEQG